MQIPSFLQTADEGLAGARRVGRKLLGLALFPVFVCGFTVLLGTCLQSRHDRQLRLAREGVGAVGATAQAVTARETPVDIGGMAFAGAVGVASVLSLLVGFAKPRRKTPLFRTS